MSREHKFRAWIKSDNRMEYGVSVNPFHVGDCDRLYWKHEEVDLMEYTGVKDKNKKDVYEGDIIEFDNDIKDILGAKDGQVYYRAGSFFVSDGNSEFHNKSYPLCPLVDFNCVLRGKIVGNVFENPELLNGGIGMNKSCAYCRNYDGFIGDKNQFCDELEAYVNENFLCNKFKHKTEEEMKELMEIYEVNNEHDE